MNKISVIIVEDHPLFRQGVVDSFSLESDIEIVGVATNGMEALQIIRHLKPDVAVIDVNLPEMNGQQITRRIKAEKINTHVVLLTAYDDAEQILHAMQSGASAYCAKDIMPEELIDIVRVVSTGKYVVDSSVLDDEGLKIWLAQKIEGSSRTYSDPGDPFHPLSDREMEVLECVTLGMSNKEIALSLGISHQTVKNHVTAVLRKLGVEDRTQAAVYALRRGWVRLYDNKDSDTQE